MMMADMDVLASDAPDAAPAFPPQVEGQVGYWDIDAIADALAEQRRRWRDGQSHHAEFGGKGFPSRANLTKIMQALCAALFPLRLGPEFVSRDNEAAFVAQSLQTVLSRLYGQIRLELGYVQGEAPGPLDDRAATIIGAFASALPEIRALLDEDVEAAFRGDPAARSVDEVLICYPSMVAITHHRLAHLLHRLGAPLVARIISAIAYGQTGIDIHPGATIGSGFFIDHGSGVVIGETAIVGDRVRLYQGVTLGARGDSRQPVAKGAVDLRHPIIEDDVIIYAGATILGRVIVGRDTVILGNVWLTESVPAHSIVGQARASCEIRSRVDVSAPHRLREGVTGR